MTTENDSAENQETTEVEIDDSALLAAMDEGITEVSPHIEKDEDDGADDAPAGDSDGDAAAEGEGDSDEADAGDSASSSDGEEGDGESDADSGDTDSADAESDSKSETDSDGKDGTDGAESAADAGEPDHINDPIPETTNEKTAERIKGLIEIAKTQTARGDQGDEIVTAITEVGADAEQFNNTLGFLQMYNSKDPAQRKQALAVAKGVVHELSIELGEGSVELLAQHQDLQDQITAGSLTEANAIEIATGREKVKQDDARNTATQAQADKTKETEQQLATGKQQLTDFGTSMAADPAYVALYPTFTGVLKNALRSVHPLDYGATAKAVYEGLKANYTPAPVVTPDEAPTGKQPRRAKTTAGGGADKSEEPKSAVEAMSAAIDF